MKQQYTLPIRKQYKVIGIQRQMIRLLKTILIEIYSHISIAQALQPTNRHNLNIYF